MDFERTTDNALKSMGIGVDARLKDLGVKFLRTQHGEPIFVKGEDPQTTVSVRPVNWNAEQLRAIADYLDAHPETTKCIEVIDIIGEDNSALNALKKYTQACSAGLG